MADPCTARRHICAPSAAAPRPGHGQGRPFLLRVPDASRDANDSTEREQQRGRAVGRRRVLPSSSRAERGPSNGAAERKGSVGVRRLEPTFLVSSASAARGRAAAAGQAAGPCARAGAPTPPGRARGPTPTALSARAPSPKRRAAGGAVGPRPADRETAVEPAATDTAAPPAKAAMRGRGPRRRALARGWQRPGAKRRGPTRATPACSASSRGES